MATKKNGGAIPQCHDKRMLEVPIGCGNCIECCKQRARGWQLRMLEEVKHNKNGKFITLTFRTESLIELGKEVTNLTGYNKENKIAKIAMRRFNERWRKKYKTAIRHWTITELGHGETEHIHIHGILWTDKTYEEIEEKWQYGYIWPRKESQKYNYVSERTVNYLMKYIAKRDPMHEYYKPIILTSPGIGNRYTERVDAKNNKYKPGETKETYTTRTGHKIILPTYWRNKIYSEEERIKLWIEKLDKNERYVLGERVTEEEYNNAIQEAQRKNKRLGYKGREIDEEKRRAENNRRAEIMAKRAKSGLPTHTSQVRHIVPTDSSSRVNATIMPNYRFGEENTQNGE